MRQEAFSFQNFALAVVASAWLAACQGATVGTTAEPTQPAPATPDPDALGYGPAVAPTCLADSDCAPLQTEPCAQALCEPKSRRCIVVPRAEFAVCVSDDLCVGAAVCAGGTCTAQAAKSCDDANPCTHDTCNSDVGCGHGPKTLAACSDGNPCTLGDFCKGGACVTKANVCACAVDADCGAFANNDKCIGGMQCVKGACAVDPAKAISCDDGNPCTTDACLPAVGTCSHVAATAGAACDDGDLCTSGGVCVAGACVSAGVLPCGANEAGCPAVCDPKLGCVGAPGAAVACDDGSACTTGDTCLAGSCVGTPACGCKVDGDCDPEGKGATCLGKPTCLLGACAVDANLAVPCGADTQEPCQFNVCTAKGCQTVPAKGKATCDDGTACTAGDACDEDGTCVSGVQVKCDDGSPCTVDFCDLSKGCVSGPGATDGLPCEDGSPCTQGDTCKTLACIAGQDSCDDGDGCTLDLCDPSQPDACLHQGLPSGADCNDGDPCSEGGTCIDGQCLAVLVQDCDDGNLCTDDACAGGGDCTHKPSKAKDILCNDADACTTADACLDGNCVGTSGACQCQKTADCLKFEDKDLCNGTLQCVGGTCVVEDATVVTCGVSGKPCVGVQCQAATGKCVELAFAPGGVCSDGNACTNGDACGTGGVCLGGTAIACTDTDPCTLDTCDAKAGCVHGPGKGMPCDDGNNCTFGDICGSSGCVAGKNACECVSDGDCKAFDDGNVCNGGLVCKAGSCINDGKGVTCPAGGVACSETACDPQSGNCVTFALPDGTTCGAASVCSSGGQCKTGACVGATNGSCDDGNPCTKDACNPGGCSFVALVGAACTDGDSCTTGEVCTAGGTCGGGKNTCTCKVDGDCPNDGDLCNGVLVCAGGTCQAQAGSVVTCDPQFDGPCQKNTCAVATGNCAQVLAIDNSVCSDGSACTGADTCKGGLCKPGAAPNCDDKNLCTDDGCSPAGGCFHLVNNKSCDDGNGCTLGDQCQAGACTGVGTCNCALDSECAAKDDGNKCNGLLLCKKAVGATSGTCTFDPATFITCDGAGDGPCSANVCEPAVGKCAVTNFPDGTGCSDGTACTALDNCATGACKGTPVPCDDGNPCTNDSCDVAKGCVITANTAACSDGNACTSGDVCVGGSCKAGVVSCQCANSSDCKPFEDNDLCNGSLVCQAGKCVVDPATQVACGDDGKACTTAVCDGTTGKCSQKPLVDGQPCGGGELCNGTGLCSLGACIGKAGCPDDGKPCTTATCDDKGGCSQVPVVGGCDDGNACTVGDSCQGTACVPGPDSCNCKIDSDCAKFDDGNACNGVFGCQAGQCKLVAGSPIVCPPAATPCQLSACDPAKGKCVVKTQADGTPCDDGNNCTSAGQCFSGTCLVQPVSCDDKNPCTTESCVPGQGCVVKNVATFPNPTSCDDGEPCTILSFCQNGKCTGFGNCACQTDSQCKDDGNLCNGISSCQGGTCKPKPNSAIVCDPSADTACSKNTCQSATATCQKASVPPGTSCSDGSLCTGGDVCAAGTCIGVPLGCNDGVACTKDSCDPKLGCVSTPTPGSTCDDSSPCTLGDTCLLNGTCAGTTVTCNDGNACTIDACDSKNGGCSNLPTTGTCDDGNPCTSEACDAGSGACVAQPAPGKPCDDGNACTTGDVCGILSCDGKAIACNDGNPCTTDACDPKSGQCGSVLAQGFAANFDDGSMAGITEQSLMNSQVKWMIDSAQAVSKPNALYVGQVLPFTGKHTYASAPAATTATLPQVTIPAGVTEATFTFDLYFDRDPTEAPGCGGFTDTFTVLVNNQPQAAICENTGGFVPIKVVLPAGQPVTIGLAFVSNVTKNNGQGAWVDNLKVGWSCP